MIYIAIEHCNGEIMDKPILIKWRDRKKYCLQGYLVFEINVYTEEIEEIKYD